MRTLPETLNLNPQEPSIDSGSQNMRPYSRRSCRIDLKAILLLVVGEDYGSVVDARGY